MTIILNSTTVVTPPGGGGTDPGSGGPGPTIPGGNQPRVVEQSYRVTLTGVDGSEWNLNTGPVTLQGGVKALLSATPVTHWTKTSPMVDGSRWTGMRVEQKDLPLPLTTRGDTWDKWRDVDVRFFRALSPEREATLTVTSPDSISRSLKVRFVSDGEPDDDWDPLLVGYRDYVVEFVASNPFWAGTPITRTFGLTMVPWLDPPGPPMFINAVSPLSAATIPNPGDVPAWPKYTITGPASSFRVGVGSSIIASNTPIPAGGKVIIDSAPTAQRSILSEAGERIYEQMSEVTFAPVPTGENVPVALGVFGFGAATSAQVELTPLYRRPV